LDHIRKRKKRWPSKVLTGAAIQNFALLTKETKNGSHTESGAMSKAASKENGVGRDYPFRGKRE